MSDIKQHIFHSDIIEKLIQEAVSFFENAPIEKLPLSKAFVGCGVYALYYVGKYDHYSFYLKSSKKIPIYIGKAVPSGWRQGRLTNDANGRHIFRRINEHTKNIAQSNNLSTEDFETRFMLFSDETINLISTIESCLIRKYNPLWNSVIDGFGNHDPGKGRYNQAISEWDFLHPGRVWVERLSGQKPELKGIVEKIKKYMENLHE